MGRQETQAAPLHPELTPAAHARLEIEPASGRRRWGTKGSGGLTRRDAALASGYVTAEQYDRWVRPGEMVGPG